MNYSKLKSSLKYYLNKLLSFLRVKIFIGGMEISDAAIRFAYFDGRSWLMRGLRLEPGIIETGKIKDYEKFVFALRDIKAKVFGEKEIKKKVSTIVSLSSISIYSQVFSLPIVEGENLDKAIQLNVQMVSPVEASQAYSGWQLVKRDQDALRLEILSAFIERKTVDELSKALFDAGFLIVALESRALALSRVLRQEGEGIDPLRSYLLVGVDGSGLDILIVRGGQLYFEYFNPWREVMDENGQIAKEAFRAMILRSLHQVFNFYSQHWSEPVTEIVISATALKEDVVEIIKENFTNPTRELRLKLDPSVGSEWYIAMGCGLRGIMSRKEDKELSLLGIGAKEEFRREQLMDFLRLWRLIMPVSLGVLVLLFFLSDLFLVQSRATIESQELFNLSADQTKESATLQAEAKEFNRSVAMIKSVQASYLPKSNFLEKIKNLTTSSGIEMSALSFHSVGEPIQFEGAARSEDQIISFKKSLEADPQFKDINLPITSIHSDGTTVRFSMSFGIVQ